MIKTKIVEQDGYCIVNIPEEYRIPSEEVTISTIGDCLVMTPIYDKWRSFSKAIDMFSSDFLTGKREQGALSERETL